MRTLIAAALIASAAPAYAWETPQPHATASSHAAAAARSSAQGGAANANGAVTVETQRSTAAPALGGLSSGVCAGASGGMSLGFLPFGGGANYGAVDPQCTLRNNILVVAQFEPEIAEEMLRGLEGYKEAVVRLALDSNPVAPPRLPEWCSDPEQYQKFRGDLFCK